MNKIITLIAFLLLTSLGSKAQVTTVLPLGSYKYPNGAYLKDLNNELDYYVGRWEGTLNNKKYIFEFVKFTQSLRSYDGTTNGSYYYKDEIQAKLKVIDLLTNQILYDNLNITNYNDYLILGLAKKKMECLILVTMTNLKIFILLQNLI